MRKIAETAGGLAPAIATPVASGCTSSGDTPETGPVEITSSSWEFTSPGFGQKYLDLVTGFNASQSEVKVKTVNIPYATYSSMVKTQLCAGAG